MCEFYCSHRRILRATNLVPRLEDVYLFHSKNLSGTCA
jgi:hypothetical protein